MAPELEPVLAHGARMSWAGILRVGDEFGPPRRSRRASFSGASGPPLRRRYGAWSERYQRFTSNLSSPHVIVRQVEADAVAGPGLQGILHWVRRESMEGVGPGSLRRADGWPTELWRSFRSVSGSLAGGTIGEQLRQFLESDLAGEVPVVADWRAALAPAPNGDPTHVGAIGRAWVPVPARLEGVPGVPECIVSWSPGAEAYPTLSDALRSETARRTPPDLERQAEYYLERVLAKHHRVAFGPEDGIEDRGFDRTSEVQALRASYLERERRRVDDPAFGRLDRFG